MECNTSIYNFLGKETTSNTYKTFLVAGPCSVESEEQIIQTAQELSQYEVNVLRGGIWKPRTRPGSFQGIGIESLKWLKTAGDLVHLPVTVEVATPDHVEACLKHGIDVLWIGSRTTTNPFSVQILADALRGVDIPVMVKNPISPDIELWIGAFERLSQAGIQRFLAIHRGFPRYKKTTYRNDPNWQIPIELRRQIKNIPIVCDPSHICGNSTLLQTIAQEAMDLLFDGLMVEVHINPKKALSDADQQLTPYEYSMLIDKLELKKIDIDNTEYFSKIHFLRKEIDSIDRNIIASLGKRMNFSKEIGTYKKLNSISTFQPSRWNEIIENRIRFAEKNNLDREFIIRIYQLIHEESIRYQKSM